MDIMETKQAEHLPDVRNKMTAVEWLESELERACMITAFAWEDEAYFRKLLEQARQREKEQIINAIENAIIKWVIDGTKTAGSLTREIMLILKQQDNA